MHPSTFATNHVAYKGFSHCFGAFDIPASQSNLLVSISLYACLFLVMYHRERHPNQLSVYDKGGDHYWNPCSCWSSLPSSCTCPVQMAWFSVVFADIFMAQGEFNASRTKGNWFSSSLFILACCLCPTITSCRSLSICLGYPYSFLSSESAYAFCSISLARTFTRLILSMAISLFYEWSWFAAGAPSVLRKSFRHFQANRELNSLTWLYSEKIAEDRERVADCQRGPRYIGPCPGQEFQRVLMRVKVLADIDTNRPRSSLIMSQSSFEMVSVDVRGSLNKMRPGALENNTLKGSSD